MKKSLKGNKGLMPGYIIYSFLWMFFLVIPVITNNYGAGGDFKRISYDWLRMTPFFIVFLINCSWLLPKILFRGRTKLYMTMLLTVVLTVSITFQIIGPQLYKNDPELLEQRKLQDPTPGREEMQLGYAASRDVSTEIFQARPDVDPLQKRRLPGSGTPLQFVNTFLIALLVAGFNTAIAVTNKWVNEEQARKEIEKQRIQSELAFLQNQINPHFFMNTLNNIHALIDDDRELAQNAILKLSEMMRYLLYESGRGTTTLKKEIDFLRSYIKLMELKIDDCVKINFELPEVAHDVNLPPLLFISFIENAFKHGVSYAESSSLSFKLLQNTNSIEFVAINTISNFQKYGSLIQHGGIGLENIRKRLDLLYKDQYQLDITKTEQEFKVRLKIPVQG